MAPGSSVSPASSTTDSGSRRRAAGDAAAARLQNRGVPRMVSHGLVGRSEWQSEVLVLMYFLTK